MQPGINEDAFASIFKPAPLSNYLTLLNERPNWKDFPSEHMAGASVAYAGLELRGEEAAAVLQAHDYGLASLPPQSLRILDRVMSKLKENIWP